jgi:hypothetical protein
MCNEIGEVEKGYRFRYNRITGGRHGIRGSIYDLKWWYHRVPWWNRDGRPELILPTLPERSGRVHGGRREESVRHVSRSRSNRSANRHHVWLVWRRGRVLSHTLDATHAVLRQCMGGPRLPPSGAGKQAHGFRVQTSTWISWCLGYWPHLLSPARSHAASTPRMCTPSRKLAARSRSQSRILKGS